jgi:hypothetical protein
MSEEVRSWRIHLRTATEPQDLAAWINPIVRGWMTCYGRYYRTALDRLLKRINTYCGSPGVRFPRATRRLISCGSSA